MPSRWASWPWFEKAIPSDLVAQRVIDAGGLYVCPGVDMHTLIFMDRTLKDNTSMGYTLPFILMDYFPLWRDYRIVDPGGLRWRKFQAV